MNARNRVKAMRIVVNLIGKNQLELEGFARCLSEKEEIHIILKNLMNIKAKISHMMSIMNHVDLVSEKLILPETI
jgi:hypothetical protein